MFTPRGNDISDTNLSDDEEKNAHPLPQLAHDLLLSKDESSTLKIKKSAYVDAQRVATELQGNVASSISLDGGQPIDERLPGDYSVGERKLPNYNPSSDILDTMSNIVTELSGSDQLTQQKLLGSGAWFGNPNIVRTNTDTRSTIMLKLPSKKRAAEKSNQPYHSYIKKAAVERNRKELEKHVHEMLSSKEFKDLGKDYTVVTVRSRAMVELVDSAAAAEDSERNNEVIVEREPTANVGESSGGEGHVKLAVNIDTPLEPVNL
jgi:hypothetical protein